MFLCRVPVAQHYTLFQNNVCHYILGNNLNKNCPIAIIVGVLISLLRQQLIERQFHFPHRTLFVQLSYLGKHRTRKFTYFAVRSMLFYEKKNWISFFTPTFLQLFSCSKCRPCARTHAFSLFPHSLIVESMTFCYRHSRHQASKPHRPAQPFE